MFIKSFTKLSGKDRAIAGGKGASLGELTQHEIPVPPGFVALSSAFDTFIEENELGPKIEAILSGIDRKATESSEYASNEIQELILNANIPKRIENEIRIGFKNVIFRKSFGILCTTPLDIFFLGFILLFFIIN